MASGQSLSILSFGFFSIAVSSFFTDEKPEIVCEHQTGFSLSDNVLRVWLLLILLCGLITFEHVVLESNIEATNTLFGTALIVATVWVPLTSQRSQVAFVFASMCMLVVCTLCIAAVTSSSLFNKNAKLFTSRPFSTFGYSFVAGWAFLNAVVTTMVAFNYNYIPNEKCDDSGSIVPLALALGVSALSFSFRDPVIAIPTAWSILNTDKLSLIQAVSLAVLFIATVASLVRFLDRL